MEWWQTLLISIIPATITGLVSYYSAMSKAKSEIEKTKIEYEKEIDVIKEKSKSERERLQLEFELKMKEMEAQSQNELVFDFFKSDSNMFSGLSEKFEELGKASKKLDQLKRKGF